MADFVRPVIELPCPTSSTGIQADWRNRPINLDLVLTFGPSLEAFTFVRKAGEVGHLEPTPAIRFDCVGGTTFLWFFGCAEERNNELRRLCQR